MITMKDISAEDINQLVDLLKVIFTKYGMRDATKGIELAMKCIDTIKAVKGTPEEKAAFAAMEIIQKMWSMAHVQASPYKVGQMLVAKSNDGKHEGMRRVMVETKMICFDTRPVLYAIPCVPNDGMEPMPLTDWLNALIHGAEVVS
jgi:hypothetical protein